MHSWVKKAVGQLAESQTWTYAAAKVVATEPTALSALALLTHGEVPAAQKSLDWLVRNQGADGSLGVTAEQSTPCWPTSLAIVAWDKADQLQGTQRYRTCCQRATEWLLTVKSSTPPRAPYVGHDTTILGWPWVDGTHAWVEPTAFALLALRSQGLEQNPRAVLAHRLLIDRLLPHGGCNCGNTVVLGHELLPHVQPTGIAMLAIDHDSTDPRVGLSLNYLQQALPSSNTPSSLGYGLLGLSAHLGKPQQADAWLAKCYADTVRRGASAHALALLALAGYEGDHPISTCESKLTANAS